MEAARSMNALLHARETRATWRVTGADRLDYLHRMLTQDVQRLPVGQAAYACYLTVKGRILGDLLLWNAGEHLLLELEADAVPAVVPALERYVITDDVTFEDVTASTRRYVLAGPDAAAALESAGFEVPASESFVAIECGGSPGHVLRFDRRGLTSFEIAVLPDAAEDLVERLGVPQDEHRFAALCVQHAIPRFGHELGDEVLFNEAGLEEAVSWNKGCYPGQEPG